MAWSRLEEKYRQQFSALQRARPGGIDSNHFHGQLPAPAIPTAPKEARNLGKPYAMKKDKKKRQGIPYALPQEQFDGPPVVKMVSEAGQRRLIELAPATLTPPPLN